MQPQDTTFSNSSAELDRDHLGVSAKVGVGCENLPAASKCDAADQEINSRSGDTSAPAFITPVGGLFEILGGESLILKSPQLIAQSFELCRLSDAREQLLPNWANEPRSPVLNELTQRRDSSALGFTPASSVSSQSERPNSSVNENLH
jgi:hypothetical protein